MKTKIQSILASLLAVSLLTCTASAMSFPDVSKDSDCATAIEYISELKIMVGDTAGNFNPNNVVNRAEMATIICRMLGKTENLTTSNVFDDVPTTHWANAYIGQAAALGIVGGYGNGKFGPSDTVTYEQAITMVIRAIGEGDRANSNGGYPNGYLLVAEANGLLTGIQAQQGQGLSRGLVAVLLYNYYNTTPTTPNNSDIAEDGHIHQWETVHIPGTGHYETGGTHRVMFTKCNCGYTVNSDMPNVNDLWREHSLQCRKRNIFWYEDVPNSEPVYVVDWPDKDVTYCPLCGAEK